MRSRQHARILKSTTTSLEIVDTLVEVDGARISEVADHLGISKSTACNHLHTLQNAGYVVLQGDVYRPSLKFAYVGEHAMRRDPAYEDTVKVIEDLSEETPFETSFIIEENGIGRYLTPEVNQPGSYDRYAFIGQKEYLHTTSAGKAILAAFPDEYVEKIIDHWGFPSKTDQTITNRNDLFEELERIREKGYSINNGENREGIYFVGKSVHKPDGTVLGAISIGSQVTRIRKDEFERRIIKLLNEYVDRLEDRIETTL
jgi:IclR family acetate operon transcriptional repressor